MKYIITESQYNKAIDKFITYQLEPHEEKTSKKYPGSIFWVKDGEIIAEIQKSEYSWVTSKNFWIDYRIWDTISSMFSLKYIETQDVVKEWLKEHYDLGSFIPKYFYDFESKTL